VVRVQCLSNQCLSNQCLSNQRGGVPAEAGGAVDDHPRRRAPRGRQQQPDDVVEQHRHVRA
jgi:hypothetical protein